MILAANQPYLLPYFPYWQLIHAADRFLVGDDYAFIRKGWITRNYILVQGKPQYLRMEVRARSCFRLICDSEFAPVRLVDKLKTIEMAYHKAPCFQDVYPVVEHILCNPERNLAAFLTASIREICGWLGITTPIGFTSGLAGNSHFKREERIYDFCRRLNADTYLNAIGGTALYRGDEFARHGIRLRFLKGRQTPYPQFGQPFTANLSILDAMMFLSREELHERLDDYDLIDG